MKLKYIPSLALGVAVLSTLCLTVQAGTEDLVVHEWGTFTSFQGGDGALMAWKPLQTSRLPDFVYNPARPGLGRLILNMIFGKGSLVTLQRLETPVIYFYSDKEQTADLTVKFPAGSITEWFPQADLMGPSLATGAGNGAFATNESVIRWSNLRLLPPTQRGLPALNPATSTSHYFAARDTDSDYVIAKDETEKFLFYRGAGNFTTPLRVSMKSDFNVLLVNTGNEPIHHLFLFEVNSNIGNFISVNTLNPGEERTIPAPSMQKKWYWLDPLAGAMGKNMAKALVQSGLYPREAQAMVNTWKDSWFKENGLRVFYVLPRAWTDRTLPMTLNPAPKEMVRVMVGRAEILPPGMEQTLVAQLNNAKQGNAAASAQVRETLKTLGRFAEPAFYHALAAAKLQPQERINLMGLLNGGSAFE